MTADPNAAFEFKEKPVYSYPSIAMSSDLKDRLTDLSL